MPNSFPGSFYFFLQHPYCQSSIPGLSTHSLQHLVDLSATERVHKDQKFSVVNCIFFMVYMKIRD